jgi:hypothetical protein
VEDYIIHAATEFCAWVSRQRLDDVSNTYWSLLAADHYREARALLWSGWLWTEWTPKPPAPPRRADMQCHFIESSNIRWSTFAFWLWIDNIHLAHVYNSGRLVEPKWSELNRQDPVNESFVNNDIACVSHILYRLWWIHC